MALRDQRQAEGMVVGACASTSRSLREFMEAVGEAARKVRTAAPRQGDPQTRGERIEWTPLQEAFGPNPRQKP